MNNALFINGILHECFTQNSYSPAKEELDLFRQTFFNQQFLLTAFSLYGKDGSNAHQRQFMSAVPQYAVEHAVFPVWFYKTENHELLLLMNADEKTALTLIHQIYTYFFERYHCSTYWGVSRTCCSLSEFIFARKEAATALAFSFDQREGGIVSYRETFSFPPETAKDRFFPNETAQLFIKSIKTGDFSLMDFILSALHQLNTPVFALQPDSVIQFNTDMVHSLKTLVSAKYDFSEELLLLNNRCLEFRNQPELYFQALRQSCHKISEQINGHRMSQKNHLITKVTQSIQQNYPDTNLSLSNTAQYFKVSEGYLSAVFKETAGICFTDYLEKCRIDKSCTMLLETDKTILEIFACVGYNSVYSFRRAFKRRMKISPSEYRINSRKNFQKKY